MFKNQEDMRKFTPTHFFILTLAKKEMSGMESKISPIRVH